jgi:hypothetical protein
MTGGPFPRLRQVLGVILPHARFRRDDVAETRKRGVELRLGSGAGHVRSWYPMTFQSVVRFEIPPAVKFL